MANNRSYGTRGSIDESTNFQMGSINADGVRPGDISGGYEEFRDLLPGSSNFSVGSNDSEQDGGVTERSRLLAADIVADVEEQPIELSALTQEELRQHYANLLAHATDEAQIKECFAQLIANPSWVTSPEEEQIRATLEELIMNSSYLRSAIKNFIEVTGKSAIIFMDSMLPLAVWAILENIAAGFPTSFRRHMDELERAIPLVMMAACALKAAYAARTNDLNKYNATIAILYHMCQAIEVCASAWQLSLDTIVSIMIQVMNPESGSVSSDALNDLFYYAAILPAGIIGVSVALMDLGEAMSELAEKYEVTIPLKNKIPENVLLCLEKIYPSVRSLIRGTFVTGGLMNGWITTIIENVLEIDLATYPALVRTLIYTVPHAFGLLYESLLNRYVSNETRHDVNFAILLMTSAMYMTQKWESFNAEFHSDLNQIEGWEGYWETYGFIVANAVNGFLSIAGALNASKMLGDDRSIRERLFGVVDPTINQMRDVLNLLLRNLDTPMLSQIRNQDSPASDLNLSCNDKDGSDEALDQSADAASSENSSFRSDENLDQSEEVDSSIFSESSSFSSDEASEHLANEESESEVIFPIASYPFKSGNYAREEAPVSLSRLVYLQKQVEAREARRFIRGLDHTLFAPVSMLTPKQAQERVERQQKHAFSFLAPEAVQVNVQQPFAQASEQAEAQLPASSPRSSN